MVSAAIKKLWSLFSAEGWAVKNFLTAQFFCCFYAYCSRIEDV